MKSGDLWRIQPAFAVMIMGPLAALAGGIALGWILSWRATAATRQSIAFACGAFVSGVYVTALLGYGSPEPVDAVLRSLPIMIVVVGGSTVIAWMIPTWARAERTSEETMANRRAAKILLVPAVVFLVWQLWSVFTGR